jgi:hypothetical protein
MKKFHLMLLLSALFSCNLNSSKINGTFVFKSNNGQVSRTLTFVDDKQVIVKEGITNQQYTCSYIITNDTQLNIHTDGADLVYYIRDNGTRLQKDTSTIFH